MCRQVREDEISWDAGDAMPPACHTPKHRLRMARWRPPSASPLLALAGRVYETHRINRPRPALHHRARRSSTPAGSIRTGSRFCSSNRRKTPTAEAHARSMRHHLRRLFPHPALVVDLAHQPDPRPCHVARLRALVLAVNAAGETSDLLESTTCSSSPVDRLTVALAQPSEDGAPIGRRPL